MTLLYCLSTSLTFICLRPKCDEKKPSCEKCASRDAICTYPDSRPLIWVDGKPVSVNDTKTRKNSYESSLPSYTPSPRPSEVAEKRNPSLNLENIDLIIHWFTKTVYTVNPPSAAALEICQTFILDQATKHHFLLHGLLALSGLHLAESHADAGKYTQIATAHHTQGLNLYHQVLSNLNDETYSASVAFSSITIMFAFGLSRPDPVEMHGIELIDHLAQIVLLAHGWHKVARVADSLESRQGHGIFPVKEYKSKILPADIESAFERLKELDGGQDADIYAQAVNSLKSVFARLEEERKENPHAALDWVVTLPEQFVGLMKARTKIALVILGFYCVVLDQVA